MAETANSISKTTELELLADPISEPLRSLRVQGSLLLRESYEPPWAVQIPGSSEIGALLGARAGRYAAFHWVAAGGIELRVGDDEPIALRAGQLAICFGGVPHRLSVGSSQQLVPLSSLLENGPRIERYGEAGPGATSLICGVFSLQGLPLNPLLGALPAVLTTGFDGAGEGLAEVASLLSAELDRGRPGYRFAIDRLLELFCAEAVRAYFLRSDAPQTGWVRGVQDPVIGRAIGLMHAHPAAQWDVGGLARSVALSPSRFAARFAGAVGQGPMIYLTRWRMHLACGWLRASSESLAEIGYRVGYRSSPAFQRAFKRHVGVSPGAWRRSFSIPS